MANYKVPQDVEADDKLIGPFSFRQFIYLLIVAGLIAIGVGLFNVFPILVIIPLPFALFFAALALPLKKDQPMETYLAALVSFYTKPRNRYWEPGQRDTSVEITAPKVVEESRTRDLTGEEATHRLSFLADIVDSEGYAIKGMGNSIMREDLAAEAAEAKDMFETTHFDNLASTIAQDEGMRHAEVVEEMREAIQRKENFDQAALSNHAEDRAEEKSPVKSKEELLSSDAIVQPGAPIGEEAIEGSNVANKSRVNESSKADSGPSDVEAGVVESAKNEEQNQPKPSIIELANNTDFSIATIAKEAERIKNKEKGEVFVSLH